MGCRGRRGAACLQAEQVAVAAPSHLGLLTVGRRGPRSSVHWALTLICSQAHAFLWGAGVGTEARTAALGPNPPCHLLT